MNMNTYLKTYIELNIIDEYAVNEELSAYSDLSTHEHKNLIDVMFEHDPVTRDWLFDRMQELIDARLAIVSCEKKWEAGFFPDHDNQTGEVIWRKQA